MNAKISDGKVVAFHYTLTDDEGTVIDTSDGEEPLTYLQGAQNIVPGLESKMEGRGPGEKFDVIVQPVDGYGEATGEGMASAPRSAFPDDVELVPGMPLVMEDEEGEEREVWVSEVSDDEVIIDIDHPLAGVTLHFAVEIITVRDASDEEKEHGHAHDGAETVH